MIRIEAPSLEEAYAKAAQELACSITEIDVEVVQQPGKGLRQKLFKKNAIIIANCKIPSEDAIEKKLPAPDEVTPAPKKKEAPSAVKPVSETSSVKGDISNRSMAPIRALKKETTKAKSFIKEKISTLNETILPHSFVTDQHATDQDDERATSRHDYAKKSSVTESFFEEKPSIEEVAAEVRTKINHLFENTCFQIDVVNVEVYDDNTLLIEFTGEDAALLIGKEGYRYKALSYMLFNWINATYQLQLRLEIAEFLKNQEESVERYLVGVYENIDREGKAQTKILDGVLVQIALRELRDRYADKYVAIRSTRDGAKYIIINSYNDY